MARLGRATPNYQRARPVTIFSTPPATTGYIQAWNGAAFVKKPVKVWTGAVWVVKPVKFWDGATWRTTS